MPMFIIVLSMVFLFFYLGYFMLPRNLEFSLVIAGSFIISLVISWILFLVSYYAGIPGYWLLMIFLGIVVSGTYIRVKSMLQLGWKESDLETSIQLNYYDLLVAVLSVCSVILFGMYVYKYYTITFLDWDAVVSWNRWAKELSENRYFPINAAYPILFPALWSLIYKIQTNSEFWIVTKASLLVMPICLIVYSTALSFERKNLFPILACLLFFIIFGNRDHMLNGYMDMPVSELGLFSCILFWDFLTKSETNKFKYYPLYLSLVSSGLASITKQPGIIFLILVLSMTFCVRKLWKNNRKDIYIYSSVSIFLPLSFILFFIDHISIHNVFGNYNQLSELTIANAQQVGVLGQALNRVLELIPGVYLVIMFLFSAVAVFFSREYIRIFVVLCLAAFIVGSIGWIYSTSYDVRNYYFALSIWIVLCAIGIQYVLEFTASLISGQMVKKVLISIPSFFVISIPLFLAITTSIFDNSKWTKLNLDQRFNIVPYYLRQVLDSIAQSPDAKIITNWQLLRYVPGFENRYVSEGFNDLFRLKSSKYFKNGNFIFILNMGIGKEMPPDVVEFIKTLLQEGKLIEIQTDFYKITIGQPEVSTPVVTPSDSSVTNSKPAVSPPLEVIKQTELTDCFKLSVVFNLNQLSNVSCDVKSIFPSGWNGLEGWGIWSTATAEMEIDLPKDCQTTACDLKLSLTGVFNSTATKPKKVFAKINGQSVGQWSIVGWQNISIPLDAKILQGQIKNIKIQFDIPNAESPGQINRDTRTLGIGLIAYQLIKRDAN